MEYIKDIVAKIETNLELLLSSYNYIKGDNLLEAIKYSVFSGGKRIRPFLVMATSQIFNVNEEFSLNVACAIELIHTYSLIHDDLPSIDNDNLRRGKETCHIKFNEATALLAGDALQSLAFELLASPVTHIDPSVRCELIVNIAKAIGLAGMAGGQMIDINTQNSVNSADEIVRLHRMKTGELFAVSCESGSILAKASRNIRLALRGYAISLGQAFQIIDDINDFDMEMKQGAKKPSLLGNNFLSIMDKDKAYKQACLLIEQAKSHLTHIGEKTDLLKEFADDILLSR